MTQKDVAEALGKSPSTIATHERGGTPRPELLAKYATLYGVTLDELLGRSKVGENTLSLEGLNEEEKYLVYSLVSAMHAYKKKKKK